MPLLLTFMLLSCTSIPKREATPSRPSSSLIFWSLSCCQRKRLLKPHQRTPPHPPRRMRNPYVVPYALLLQKYSGP
ncbi:uncharacterized protein G2W53_011749 [Senna tora]|uniref:Secreted protein n=1 Tax=Senna tora TaxID=362788 RepID=A0A834X3B5_9FABA|nr:uncharacterized protein G2W53_011749 [Senna tora]